MDITQSTQLAKALADTSRLKILGNLLERPSYVEELSERLGLAPSTVSFHLKKLESVGLVTREKEQYYVVYRANDALLDLTLRAIVSLTGDCRSAEERNLMHYFEKVLTTFFEAGRLRQLPAQRKKRRIVLEAFAREMELGKTYDEPEINALITRRFRDYCTVRREMICEGMVEREGQRYRRIETLRIEQLMLPDLDDIDTKKKVSNVMDRRAIVRDYKLSEKVAGIYWIKNKVSGKVLIGSSLNLHGPLNRHRAQLDFGSHRCEALRKDWAELGPESFDFEIVEEVKRGKEPDFDMEAALKELEQKWIEKLQPFEERCYNSSHRIRTCTY